MAAAAAEGPMAEGPKGWGRCGRSGRVTGCWGKVGGGGGSGGKWGQLPEKYKNKIKSSVASTKFFCSSHETFPRNQDWAKKDYISWFRWRHVPGNNVTLLNLL